ncbi:hypothetical protein C7U60_08735 [Mesorhizobium plurifarium]|nr:hypothetical protein C7U60_08735 [Mesorhizobium plurifarium]
MNCRRIGIGGGRYDRANANPSGMPVRTGRFAAAQGAPPHIRFLFVARGLRSTLPPTLARPDAVALRSP